MGIHHFTDHVCNICHEFVGEDNLVTCEVGCGGTEGCKECMSKMESSQIQEYLGTKESLKDDEVEDGECEWVCLVCWHKIKRQCVICNVEGTEKLVKCNKCDRFVCISCRTEIQCWACSKEEVLDCLMKQLEIPTKKAAMELVVKKRKREEEDTVETVKEAKTETLVIV